MHILVVDDHIVIANGIRDFMRRIAPGASFDVALSLKSAQQSVATKAPDVILTDLQMSDTRGVMAVTALRAAAPAAWLIVTSGSDEPDIAQRSLAAGANDFVHKGYDLDMFFDDLRQVYARGAQPRA